MKKNPKVSIIIPVYNGKNFIKEAIDSALSQTYDNIEILIVNDGSDDNGATKKIVQKYGNKVKYFEKQNGGVSTALNLALKKMTGDFFSWLSHDDRYYPNKISDQIEYLELFDDHTILYSDYDLMDENSQIFSISKKDHDELMKKPYYSLLRGAINGITLLIPRKAFQDYGKFDEELKCTQDYDMWLRMMKTYKFIHQPKVLATTRLHSNQTTNISDKVIVEGNKLWINMLESFPDEMKIQYEFSLYSYYQGMLTFMKTTPYDAPQQYLQDKINLIEQKVQKKVKNVKVSIIIPFYNRIDETNEAIRSALNQTHKNIEIILVNDGSKDIKNLMNVKDYHQIKLINLKKNQGASFARNIGIDESTGEYISLLDSDDLFLPTKIEKQLFNLLCTNSDFSYTSYIKKSQTTVDKVNCYTRNYDILNTSIYNCNIATPTVMIKAAQLKKWNIKYDVQKKYGEDICFYLEIFKKTSPTFFDDYLTIVNVNEESSATAREKQIIGLKTIIKYLLNDEFYNKFDEEISLLCYSLYTVMNPDLHLNDLSISNDKRVDGVCKYLKILKTKGPFFFLKRCMKRIVGKQ